MSRGSGPRILTAIAVVTMVVSVIGFVATLMLNTVRVRRVRRVRRGADSRLEQPAPARRGRHRQLPHRHHRRDHGGGGLPVPPLKHRHRFAPRRAEEPDADARTSAPRRRSTTTPASAGFLHVRVVGGPDSRGGHVRRHDRRRPSVRLLNPTLAFGHGSPPRRLAVSGSARRSSASPSSVLVIARVWAARGEAQSRTDRRLLRPADRRSACRSAPPEPFTPTEDGIRIEQLNTLARLRDSGALTEDEFEAEKRRILDGP